jgi:hypothetical protein
MEIHKIYAIVGKKSNIVYVMTNNRIDAEEQLKFREKYAKIIVIDKDILTNKLKK